MANKEIHVSFDKISDPQTITRVNKQLMAERDLDIHKNEVVELIDDHDQRKRVYKLKKAKYFGPWSYRG